MDLFSSYPYYDYLIIFKYIIQFLGLFCQLFNYNDLLLNFLKYDSLNKNKKYNKTLRIPSN